MWSIGKLPNDEVQQPLQRAAHRKHNQHIWLALAVPSVHGRFLSISIQQQQAASAEQAPTADHPTQIMPRWPDLTVQIMPRRHCLSAILHTSYLSAQITLPRSYADGFPTRRAHAVMLLLLCGPMCRGDVSRCIACQPTRRRPLHVHISAQGTQVRNPIRHSIYGGCFNQPSRQTDRRPPPLATQAPTTYR
jgi:hypothetical protein